MTGRFLLAEAVVVQTDVPGCPGTRSTQTKPHRWSLLSHSEKPWAPCVPSQACSPRYAAASASHNLRSSPSRLAVSERQSRTQCSRVRAVPEMCFPRFSQRWEIVGISKRFGEFLREVAAKRRRQSPSANTHTAPPSGTSGNSPGRMALSRPCIPRASMPHPDCTATY